MHKVFYASGFLFHPRSQQILLRQSKKKDKEPTWSLFSKKAANDKTDEENFKDIFLEEFSFDISKRKVHKIYTYYSEIIGNQNLCYAEVGRLQDFSSEKGTYKWFNAKQITKLNISEQDKHDIVVGIRVIDSSIRKRLGMRTIGE